MFDKKYSLAKLPAKISIDPKLSGDVNYLLEEVTFPVILMGENNLQAMRATRFDCIKHKLEHGVYRSLQFREGKPCLIMLSDGTGADMGDEKPDGKQKGGKSVASLITGKSYSYHHKDGDVLNNMQANFEYRMNKKRRKVIW